MGMWRNIGTGVGTVVGGVVGTMFGGQTAIGAGIGGAVGGMAGGGISGEDKKEELQKSALMQELSRDTGKGSEQKSGFDYSDYYDPGGRKQEARPQQESVSQPQQSDDGGGMLGGAMDMVGSLFGGGGGAAGAGVGGGGGAAAAGSGGGMAMFAEGGIPNSGRPAFISDAQSGQTTGMMNERAPEAVVPLFGSPGNQNFGGNFGSDQQINTMSQGINQEAGQIIQEEAQAKQTFAPYAKQFFGQNKEMPGEEAGTFENKSITRMEHVPGSKQTLQPRLDKSNQQEQKDFFTEVFGDVKNEFAGTDANYGDAARMLARGFGFYYDMRRERVGLGKSGLTRWLDWNEAGQLEKKKGVAEGEKAKLDLDKWKAEGWTPKEILDDKGNKTTVYYNPRTGEQRDKPLGISAYKTQGERTDVVNPKTNKLTTYEYDPATQEYKPIGISKEQSKIEQDEKEEAGRNRRDAADLTYKYFAKNYDIGQDKSEKLAKLFKDTQAASAKEIAALTKANKSPSVEEQDAIYKKNFSVLSGDMVVSGDFTKDELNKFGESHLPQVKTKVVREDRKILRDKYTTKQELSGNEGNTKENEFAISLIKNIKDRKTRERSLKSIQEGVPPGDMVAWLKKSGKI
jgi:hypothetical protein